MNKKNYVAVVSAIAMAAFLSGAMFTSAFAANRDFHTKDGRITYKALEWQNNPTRFLALLEAVDSNSANLVYEFGSKNYDYTKLEVALKNGTTFTDALKDTSLIVSNNNLTVSSVSAINDKMNVGDDYTLPTTVIVNLSNGTTKNLPVIWYEIPDTKVAGTYKFTGTLTMVNGVVNTNNITIAATLNVIATATIEERGNTVGNIVNDGLVAEKDGFIYYANPADKNTLYKLNISTGEKEKLGDTSEDIKYINLMGGWVYYYYYNYYSYKIRTDGTELTSISNNGSYLNIVDRYFYGGRTFLNVSGKSKYYAHSNLYKCDLDGNNGKELTTYDVSYINVVGDWIYYINLTDNKIYRMKTDGTNATALASDFAENLNVSDRYIYYVNSEDRFIYRMKTDGTSKEQISYNASSKINIAGGWLYYVNPVTKIEYRINLTSKSTEKVN
ncbi:DUF5050 domain-containing protein [Clostridium sp. FP2]|uniref:DUF5050 domain-containing protein n=1 Tax=Clostridium sp. FP2 TaxID=2724481 RepID=UPI0013E90468|nr:DUF5050 domain-containing protein [Clostridium sp. FP2]MBZ9625200.1 DUF5050 domain-containing protein [Clostridium sp. FP2]